MRSSRLVSIAAVLFVLVCTLAFHAAAQESRFPLRASADHRYLVDRSGHPFLIHGDSPWELLWNVAKDDEVIYLDDRQKKGFNTLLIDVLPYSEWTNHRTETNRAGQNPFLVPGDLSKPNEAYFKHLDWLLGELERRGMLAALVVADLGYAGMNFPQLGAAGGMWWVEYKENGPEKCHGFARYLGERYKARPNILWVLGGDRDPGDVLEQVEAMARGLKEAAPRQLVTYHAGAKSSTLFFHTAPWLDINTSYGYEEPWDFVGRDVRLAPRKPAFLGESGYEGESNDGRGGTPQRVRRQAWGALLSGACGHLYGSVDWKMLPGWKARLDWPGVTHMGVLKRFFESIAWEQLQPDSESRLVVNGRREREDFAPAARLADGTLGVVYLPTSRRITVDMSQMAAPATMEWLDPTSGARVPAEADPLPPSGLHTFAPPPQNSAHDSDFVLILRAAK